MSKATKVHEPQGEQVAVVAVPVDFESRYRSLVGQRLTLWLTNGGQVIGLVSGYEGGALYIEPATNDDWRGWVEAEHIVAVQKFELPPVFED